MGVHRRQFLKSAAGVASLLVLPSRGGHADLATARSHQITLRAAPVEQLLAGGGQRVRFWGFNDHVPGPPLRFRKGDNVRITVRNDLQTDTTVHWHGLRVPNAMDGVPQVTQDPIKPGSEFVYEYNLRDSGTFWYHPHQSSFEQVPRGLYGAYIVEETRPIEVDREVVWVLSDVKLGADGQQVEDYGRMLDLANEGRVGNRVLINGEAAGAGQQLAVRSGERIRLRLINAASARIFRLRVDRHVATVVAYDGQAVEPHVVEATDLGPGMRADVVIDCVNAPGSSASVRDIARRGIGEIARIAYAPDKPLRDRPLGAPLALEANALPEPNPARATDHYIVFQGGMRGAPVIGNIDGKATRIHDLMERHGLAWTMNYSAQHEHALMHEPLLYLDQGEHVVLRMINDTDFAHPMHLHGHFFRVLGMNGDATAHPGWRDTVLMGPRQSLDIAFVADNPGEWMFHCHILDHAAGGMMGTIAVT